MRSDPDHTSDIVARPGPAPSRQFTHVGVVWIVTETDGTRVPAARGRTCLVFASPEVIRRVWDYPSGWHTLPDAALFALSWRR